MVGSSQRSGLDRPRLYGRDDAVATIEEALDRARSGAGGVVSVEGEGGIGKSRLVDEACASARERGFQIFRGRSDELERHSPFACLAEAFAASYGGEKRSPIYGLLIDREAGSPTGEFRITDAIGLLCEEAASEQPACIALDDMQWADSASLRAARTLSRRLAHHRVLFILSFRPSPRPRELERLIAASSAEGSPHLELGPLSGEHVTELAAQILRCHPGPRLERHLGVAAGNPLFVGELVCALDEEGAIRRRNDVGELTRSTLPPSLRQTVLRRLSSLEPATLDVLRMASVLGSSFSTGDLGAFMGRSGVSLVDPLREAIRARFVGEHDELLRFRHDLIREAVYEDFPAGIRRTLHLEAARALAEAGAPATQVAGHFALGAAAGNLEAVDWLLRAAREQGVPAPAVAIDLYEAALALLPRHSRLRDAIGVEMIQPLIAVGRPGAGLLLAQELLERPVSPELQVKACRGGHFAASMMGRADASAFLERALRLPDLDAADRIWFLVTLGLASDDRSRLAEALSLARSFGDLRACVRPAVALLGRGTDAQALLPLADEAVAEARRAVADQADGSARQGLFELGDALLARARLLRTWGNVASWTQDIGEVRRLCDESGSLSYTVYVHMESAWTWFLTGAWDDAAAEAEAGWALTREYETFGDGLACVSTLAGIAAHRGDATEAARLAEEANALYSAAAGPQAYPHYELCLARAFAAQARGDHAQAEAAFRACAGPQHFSINIMHARQARAAGTPGLAEETASAAATLAKACPEVTTFVSSSGVVRGIVDDDPDLLVQAVSGLRRLPYEVLLAFGLEEAGSASMRSGRRDDAVPLLEEAGDLYEDLTAKADAARVLAALREAGVRRGVRGPRRRPSHGWESLTQTEMRVTALVADGLTNLQVAGRLYVSPRTVSTHLSHIYGKLGVSSRTELAAAHAKRA